MKLIGNMIIYFLIINCEIIYSQKDYFLKSKINEVHIADTLKQEIISNLDHSVVEYLLSKFNELPVDNFIFVDYDNDGDIDIIYSGDIGTEENSTIFFENRKGTYNVLLEVFGNLISIIEDEHGLPFVYQIYDYGCCDENTEFIEYYSLFKDSLSEKSLRLIKKIGFMKNTFHPEIIDRKYLFVTTRTVELINNPYNDSEAVLTIPSGINGTILFREDDNYFILLSDDHKYLNNKLDSRNNNQADYFILGWLKGNTGIQIVN
jgi:hypothetical protein